MKYGSSRSVGIVFNSNKKLLLSRQPTTWPTAEALKKDLAVLNASSQF
jgi:hypothetical protein